MIQFILFAFLISLLSILNYHFNTEHILTWTYLFEDIIPGENTLTIKAGLSYYLILN